DRDRHLETEDRDSFSGADKKRKEKPSGISPREKSAGNYEVVDREWQTLWAVWRKREPLNSTNWGEIKKQERRC
ncbi:MAG: hypothetical protein ACK5Z0_03015, partial [Planctomycetota bacterium]